MRIFQDEVGYLLFGEGPSGFSRACSGLRPAQMSFQPLDVSDFSSIVRQQVTTGLSEKTHIAGAQILGQEEMKGIYFRQNVLFISVQNQ